MSTKSLIIAAAVGLAAIAGGVGAASAKPMGKNMGLGIGMGMGNHPFFHHHGLRVIVGSGYAYDDCGDLFGKWQWTGSLYWKGRYLACKYGGW